MSYIFRALISVALVCSFSALPLHAEETADTTFAVVDWRIALFQSNAAEEEDKRMQQENLDLVTRATELERDIEQKSQSLERDQDILSEEEVATLRTELSRSMREYEGLGLRLQQIQAEAEARFVGQQRDNIDKAMQILADKYNLDYVIERQALVYGRKVRNLTQELIAELNKLQ